MALIRKQPKQQGRVGNTYGERREQIHNRTAQPRTQKPQVPKPLDKFGIAGKKTKTGLAGFAANATFRAARRFYSKDVPHRPARLDSMENGATPVAASTTQPSDNAILKFLNRVIDVAPTNPRIARNRAAKQRVAPAKTRPQPAGQQVVRTARPRTTKA